MFELKNSFKLETNKRTANINLKLNKMISLM